MIKILIIRFGAFWDYRLNYFFVSQTKNNFAELRFEQNLKNLTKKKKYLKEIILFKDKDEIDSITTRRFCSQWNNNFYLAGAT